MQSGAKKMSVIQRGNKRGWFHRAGSDWYFSFKSQHFLFIPNINSLKYSNPGSCWAELSRQSHPSLLISLMVPDFDKSQVCVCLSRGNIWISLTFDWNSIFLIQVIF